MNNIKKYPSVVCITCLQEACEDTKTYEDRVCKWSSVYSCYIDTCQVCGESVECTEPRDAGFPSFDYAKQRLRSKKINKIIKNQ